MPFRTAVISKWAKSASSIQKASKGFAERVAILGSALSGLRSAHPAIFAKLGVENVSSDLATLIRTIIILVVLGILLVATRQFQNLGSISPRTYAFLMLSGRATGASWICYFRTLKLGDAAQSRPLDKLSVVLVAVFGVFFLREHLFGLGLVS